jgi:ribA/ribD-fused uncharacterized protein
MQDVILFWKPNQEYGEFSQWSDHSFELLGLPFANDGESVRFNNAEQAMMVAKASTFGDYDMIPIMMDCDNPSEIRKLGRQVKNFDDEIWKTVRDTLVYRINLSKFQQNTQLSVLLQQTTDSIIAEASPFDRNWGIGLSKSHINAKNPEKWRGKNLLGKALMKVREEMRDELSVAEST